MGRNRTKKNKRGEKEKEDAKTALDALSEVKRLQKNVSSSLSTSPQTIGASGKVGRSVGSSDIRQDDFTGGSLQWYEKLQDEKLNSVETRLGAKTTEMILGVKSELEEKISGIKDSNTKHVIAIILSIFLAFLAFYFAGLDSIEDKVEKRVSMKIKELSGMISDIDRKLKTKNPPTGKSLKSHK